MPDSIALALAASLEDGGWRAKARPDQIMPDGDHNGVLIIAGRGWGKTRTGCEWVREQAMSGTARIALIGSTAADVRDVIVEGESGLLAISPDWDRPDYEPSKRRLTWKNGSIATCFSAEEADRLRGPQHTAAYADEVAAWPDAQAVFNMLMFGLRLGPRPQWVITTTPRPTPFLRALLAREGKDVIVRRGGTFDNAKNLAPSFLSSVQALYGGSRLGRQELLGEMLEDTPGALFKQSIIDKMRIHELNKDLRRVVVSIDPAVTCHDGSDETGIICAGVDDEGLAYILEDASLKAEPHVWAKRAVQMYHKYNADVMTAESNNGGELVRQVIRSADQSVPVKLVTASRGKYLRAEPISLYYEQFKVIHVGEFSILESQMTSWAPGDKKSPDRLDALVWALAELKGVQYPGQGWLDLARAEMAALANEPPPEPIKKTYAQGSMEWQAQQDADADAQRVSP